jgi:hypothetical protein
MPALHAPPRVVPRLASLAQRERYWLAGRVLYLARGEALRA